LTLLLDSQQPVSPHKEQEGDDGDDNCCDDDGDDHEDGKVVREDGVEEKKYTEI
jgi:hypothetical protein